MQPAFAQTIYLQPNKTQKEAPKADEQIDELLGKKAPQQAPQTLGEYARAYHQNCLATDHPILAGKDLEDLCGCTANNFLDVMTLEQVLEMQQSTSEGLFQRNRMLLFVYAPCIEYPTRTMILKECMGQTRNKFFMKNQSATCSCLANGVAEDLKELAPKYIENALRRNEKTLDPLGLLMNSDHFDERMRYHTRRCLADHEGIY